MSCAFQTRHVDESCRGNDRHGIKLGVVSQFLPTRLRNVADRNVLEDAADIRVVHGMSLLAVADFLRGRAANGARFSFLKSQGRGENDFPPLFFLEDAGAIAKTTPYAWPFGYAQVFNIHAADGTDGIFH